MYQCDTLFMSLCVDDRLVCRSICSCIPEVNIQEKIMRQVGYLRGSYQDARSTKLKKYFSSYVIKKYRLGSMVVGTFKAAVIRKIVVF